MPGIPSPLANRKPGDIDFVVVRENTEGEYSSVGGRMFEGTEREIVFQESVFSRKGVDRIMSFAFELARTTRRRSTSRRRPSRTASRSRCRTGTSASAKWPRAIRTSAPISIHIDILTRAFRAAAGALRRRGRLEPVRRHPVRPRARGVRDDRHRAVGQHQSGAHVSVDCSSRCTARRPTSRARASPIRSARSGRAR